MTTTISPAWPRTSRLSFAANTGVLRLPMASKSMALAGASSVNVVGATGATAAPSALANRSKKAAATRVSIFENGALAGIGRLRAVTTEHHLDDGEHGARAAR